MLLSDKLEPRRYQELIFSTATRKNTLVVLPTGLGKTMIAAMLAAQRLEQYPKSKVIFLAPTKPLAQQHERAFKELIRLPEEDFTLFTGAVAPAKRAELFKDAKIIFSTPQGLENDLISGRITLDDVSLLIFDEAHRATGEYSYTYIAERYQDAKSPRILALTASPGTDKETITQVCQNLLIEEIEVRSEQDSDVEPYVQEVDVEWVEVPFPEKMRGVQQRLQKLYKDKLLQVRKYGYLDKNPSDVNKTTLLKAQGALHGEIAKGNREFEVLKSMSLLAEAMKIQHAIELIETQGVASFNAYIEQLRKQASKGSSKATKNLVENPEFKAAAHEAQSLLDSRTEHPKMRAIKKLILQNTYQDAGMKIIIFTQYRDQATAIKQALANINIESEVFVGQAKKGTTGLSQKAQQEMLDEFANGGFPVLIATSVAEEGLDIPKVDVVVFYEPIPSAIRTVQRRGRTGRLEKGRVVVLITKDTRDVGYRWVAHHKERRMYRVLKDVKKNLNFEDKKQPTLKEYERKEDAKGATVIADHREKGSPVLKALLSYNAKLDLQQLSVGDFLLSDRCVVEYKTIPDFVDSIIDGRLLTQLHALKQYARPLILLEGTEDIFSQRQVHPNAIRGMLATITVSYGIPIVSTRTPHESAGLIAAIAKREQEATQEFQYHTAKPRSEDERLEYVVAAIPGIGSKLAKPLLERFLTIEALAKAPVEELSQTPGIGRKKAEEIRRVVTREYHQGP